MSLVKDLAINRTGLGVGPQCSEWQPHRKRRDPEEKDVKMRPEPGAMPPQAKDGKSHQGLEEARKDPPLETLEGVWPC